MTPETAQETPGRAPDSQQPLPASDRDLRWRKLHASNPRTRVFMIIGAIVLVVVGFFVWRYLTSYESTDDAQIDGHLNPISARVSGHVQKILVQDNQFVQAGSPLVQIDPRDYQLALQKAQADYDQAVAAAKGAQVNVPITTVSTSSEVSTAQADIENARAGIAAARQQLEAARAQQQEAEANNTKVQTDLGRYRQLIQKHEISEQEYDHAVAASKAATATVNAAIAATAAAQQQVNQAQARMSQAQANLRASNTAPQRVASMRSSAQAAEAMVAVRKAAVDQAKLDLQYTLIVAPVSGVMSNRTVEVGQNIQAGQQLMTIIPLSPNDIWVTANFKENQLQDMRVGQRATIHVDATDQDYNGHVQSIAGASGSRFSLLPPENATGNFVKVVQRIPVKITFDSGQDKKHVLRPGMSVEPKVWIR